MLFPSVSRLAGARPAFGSAKRFAFLQLFFRPGNHRARQDRTWPDETVDRLPSSPKVSTALCAPWVVECGALRHCPPRQSRPFAVGSSAADCTRCRPRIPAAGDERRSRSATDCKKCPPPSLPVSAGFGRRPYSRPVGRNRSLCRGGGGPRRTPDFTRVARGLPGPLPLPFAGMLSLSGNCRPMSGLRAVCRESSGR